MPGREISAELQNVIERELYAKQIGFKSFPQGIPEHGSEISQGLRKLATWTLITLPTFNNLTMAR
jgi:hypothetical protein